MAGAAVERRSLSGMDPELGRRQGEDEPAVAVVDVDVVPAEDVPEDGPYRVGLGGVEQRMDPGDRHRALSHRATGAGR